MVVNQTLINMEDLMFTSLKKEELSTIIEHSIRKVLAENPPSKSENNPPDLLNIEEASSLLNLAKATVYALSSSGRIPVFKKSKRLYFSRSQLLDWVKTGRKKTIDEIELEAQEYSLKNKYTKYK